MKSSLFDRIFKPELIVLENGHEVKRPRSKMPLIILCLLIVLAFSIKMTGFDIEEYYTKKGVTIIEWADMIPDYLPEKRLDIRIRNSEEDENKRIITLIPHGKKYEELCEAVLWKFYI